MWKITRLSTTKIRLYHENNCNRVPSGDRLLAIKRIIIQFTKLLFCCSCFFYLIKVPDFNFPFNTLGWLMAVILTFPLNLRKRMELDADKKKGILMSYYHNPSSKIQKSKEIYIKGNMIIYISIVWFTIVGIIFSKTKGNRKAQVSSWHTLKLVLQPSIELLNLIISPVKNLTKYNRLFSLNLYRISFIFVLHPKQVMGKVFDRTVVLTKEELREEMLAKEKEREWGSRTPRTIAC